MDQQANGWSEWSRHVLLELKRLNTNIESLEDSQGEMAIEIAKLKVKSGIWGAIGGLIPVALMIAGLLIKSFVG